MIRRLLLLLALSCAGSPLVPVPLPTVDAAGCGPAAANLAALHCHDSLDADYAAPDPQTGEMFIVVCGRDLQAAAPIPVACLAAAKTCAEAEQCR